MVVFTSLYPFVLNFTTASAGSLTENINTDDTSKRCTKFLLVSVQLKKFRSKTQREVSINAYTCKRISETLRVVQNCSNLLAPERITSIEMNKRLEGKTKQALGLFLGRPHYTKRKLYII